MKMEIEIVRESLSGKYILSRRSPSGNISRKPFLYPITSSLSAEIQYTLSPYLRNSMLSNEGQTK